MATRGGMGNAGAGTVNERGAREGDHESRTDHIATSHVGSLPRPDGLIAAHRAHEAGESVDEAAFEVTLRAAVAEVVRRQRDLGIDIPGDGEFGKPMAQRVQYGSWWRYSWQRPRRTRFSTASTFEWSLGDPAPARWC